MLSGITFPVYRKYKNNKNYFKILSRLEFEEKQIIGNKVIVTKVHAYQFPEMNLIKDLILNREIADEISESEYNKI